MYTNMMTDWQDMMTDWQDSAFRCADVGRNPWEPVTGQWSDWTAGYAAATQNMNEMLKQSTALPLNFANIALERAQMMSTGQSWCLQWARNTTEAYLTWLDVLEQGWDGWFVAAKSGGVGKTVDTRRERRSSRGAVARLPQGELDLTAKGPLATGVKRAIQHDDLKRISGIGPGLERKLNAEGIHSFRQLASLKKSDIARLEKNVIKFPGRIQRDKWVEQAKKLS